MHTLFDSRMKLVAAAVAGLGMSCIASASLGAPTITYILSYNDDGLGDFTPGSYAIYASDSTESGNYGFDGIGVNIGGLNNPSDFFEDDLPIGTATPGSTNTAKKAPAVVVGFNEGYGASYPIGGAQDTPDLANSLIAGKPPAAFLTYGVGQTSGSEDSAVAAIGGPSSKFTPSALGTGTDAYGTSVTANSIFGFGGTFPAAVLVADGTYVAGDNPVFANNNNSALIFTENGQGNFNPAGGNTESIGQSGISFVYSGFPSFVPLFTLAGSNNNGGVDDAPAFGAADVNDVVTVGPGNGNYSPLKAVVNNNKGYFEHSGFTSGDAIDVALKFSVNGSDPVTGTVLTDLLNYIFTNANDTGGIGPIFINPIAYSSASASIQAALGGPGTYDVLLTGYSGGSDLFINYDFSQFSDIGIPKGSLEVTAIGIVPEPAGLGLLGMICLGFLNRRWHNRAITLPNRGH